MCYFFLFFWFFEFFVCFFFVFFDFLFFFCLFFLFFFLCLFLIFSLFIFFVLFGLEQEVKFGLTRFSTFFNIRTKNLLCFRKTSKLSRLCLGNVLRTVIKRAHQHISLAEFSNGPIVKYVETSVLY